MKQLTRSRTNSVEYISEESAPAPTFTIKDSIKPSSNGADHPNGTGTTSDRLSETEQIDLSRYVTEEEYWENYYDHADGNYEWNNGYLEEKPMAKIIQFRIYSWFLELLKDFLYVHNMGKLTGLEIGFKLNLSHKTTIRKPDIGIVLDSNPVPAADEDRTYQGIFDICIESLSDSTQAVIERDTVHKKSEYAQVGVPEYYIFDDSGAETVFYALNPFGVYIPIQPVNGVIRSRVMPGFQFRVEDLYTCPRLATLAIDPVYSAFASPEYRAERQRADEADQRADEEHQRADEEHQRADVERQRADEADQRAGVERQRADEADQRAGVERQRADEADQVFAEERQRAERAEQFAKKERQRAEEEHQRAEEEYQRAERAEQLAKEERQRAEEMQLLIEEERQRTETAQRLIEEERTQAEALRLQAAVLAEQLRAAGILPKRLDTE